jgi:hypothetical protein
MDVKIDIIFHTQDGGLQKLGKTGQFLKIIFI